jgi:hypothetical protein
MSIPNQINGYTVVEYGFFPKPILPVGYLPPPDGGPSLKPVQNVAVCTAPGIDGFYLLYCTPDWEYVTYSFNETMEYTKRNPLIELGENVFKWRKWAS